MDNSRLLEYYRTFSTREFEEQHNYQGDDLGAVWSMEETRFRVWAPTAQQVIVNLYKTGDGDDLLQCISMSRDACGTWIAVAPGDQNGIYYTYTITVDGESVETIDIYAKAAGVNGNRGMVINLASTNPEGFIEDGRPELVKFTNAIIYELHIRDFSIDQSSGMQYKGKYLAFTEVSTKNSYGEPTGMDYLKALGITHVHLLPSFDYKTVDESRLQEEQFNWGYDPQNYNIPEGSYSTDPYHGEVRIREFKQMVQSLHRNGIRVIMDVVYNHTMDDVNSAFHKTVPGYYHRLNENGSFSNGSGCGNETASERPMMRKFMLDSIVYWAKEYHIDGFRFDLMGLHDIETMNAIRQALNEVDCSILVYGEGWTGGVSPLPDCQKAIKSNIRNMDLNIAAFNDNIRDGIKGSVFDLYEKGFVSGRNSMEDTIKFGVVAATRQEWIDYGRVIYTNEPWALQPTQCINYTSAHDNYTLWDKLVLSNPKETGEKLIKMNLLSAAIVLTSQGIPFFQAGEEFLRSKPMSEDPTRFDENSYRSPDSVNSLKWDSITVHKEAVEYYQGLIALRKAYSGFRLASTAEIEANLTFMKWLAPNVVAYLITQPVGGEICVIYNANREAVPVQVPEGEWKVFVKGNKAGTKILDTVTGDMVHVEPISAMVMMR